MLYIDPHLSRFRIILFRHGFEFLIEDYSTSGESYKLNFSLIEATLVVSTLSD